MTDHLTALQEALAGEHAAVWAAGRAAGPLTGSAQRAAVADLADARAARDQLRDQIGSAGGEPVSAAPGYLEPTPTNSAGRARSLLAQVCLARVPLYARLAGTAPTGSRSGPARRAGALAARAVYWGATPQAFPGVTDNAQSASEASAETTASPGVSNEEEDRG